MTVLNEVSRSKCFGGWQLVFSHESEETRCSMKFAVYLPPQAEEQKVPVLYFLPGAASNEEIFTTKSGAQCPAAQHGVCIVVPDTSPRGIVIEGEKMTWNYGEGASYYVDATTEKWKNYRMYSYITKELPRIISEHFPVLPDKQSIMGHSMGGHGALISYLKNPGKFMSVSAFAPLCHTTAVPSICRAFSSYLGNDQEAWKEYDASCLLAKYVGPPPDILIDQGDADEFFMEGNDHLMPEHLANVAESVNIPITLRFQHGYNHGHYFLRTFIGEHVEYHAKRLFA